MNLTELHHLGRQLMSGAETAMKQSSSSDLKPVEVQVLQSLFQAGPLPVGEIAQRIRFAQSRVSTAVASLRDKGLVILGEDPADRRRTIVDVSASARSRADDVRGEEAAPVVARLFPDLSAAELERLVYVLDRLYAALAEPAPETAPVPSP